MRKYLYGFLILLITSASSVYAQTNSKTISKNIAALGFSYSTNLNFYGRTDSVPCNGLSATAEIWLSNNAFVSISPSFVSDAYQTMSYSGLSASAGFQKMAGNWFLSAGASRSFFTNSSYLSQAVIQNQVYGSAMYFNDYINLNTGVDLKFSDQMDVVTTLGIDHSFVKSFKAGGLMMIDPSITLYPGTHYFSRSFLNSKSYAAVQMELSKFQLLATEFSLPLMYLRNDIFLMMMPSYIIPNNLIQKGNLTEMGQPQFYVSLSARFKIKKTVNK